MAYNETDDIYTCPNGNLFTYLHSYERKSKSGFVSDVSVYECSGCNECPLKASCTKAKGNRTLHVSKDFVKLRQAAYDLITSDEGKELRLNRSIQVEGAFGVLKQDYGFRRLLRRKSEGVFTEILLYAFGFNINKRHNKNEREFEGIIRHMMKVA